MIGLVTAQVSHKTTASSAQIQAEAKLWADFLERAWHHQVGGPLIVVLFILLASFLLSEIVVAGAKLRHKEPSADYIKRLRNFLGLLFDALFALLYVYVKFAYDAAATTLWGFFYGGGAFGIRLAWINKNGIIEFFSRFPLLGWLKWLKNKKG